MHLAFPSPSAPLRSLLRAALGLAALVAGAAVPAGAQTPFADLPPMTASPQALLAAAAEPELAEDDRVDVLLESTRLVLEADGTSVLREHRIYEVSRGDAVQVYDEVSAVYAPWHQETPTVRARVILPSGGVHELDPSTLSEGAIESELPNTYQDMRRLVAPLPGVTPGAVVETVVDIVDRAPFFEAGALHRLPVWFGGSIRHARVVIDAPEGMELRIEARPEALAEPRVETSAGRVRRTFEARDLPPPEMWIPGQPPEAVMYPFVAVSTATDWTGLARRYSEIVDRQIAAMAAPEGGSLLAGDTPGAGAQSQWEQIAARVAWVHERVRYTGVQLGEAAIVPRPPGETLARRYGDCKDKATLVVALLREIGVPAYVALLRAGAPDDVLPDLPGLGAGGFDHAIVYVPGSPALWIDATDPHAPLGELPTTSQGRLALVASPGTRGLVRTPVAGVETNRSAETREVFLPELGLGRVEVRAVYRGSHARRTRGYWQGATEAQIAEWLSGLAATTYGSSAVKDVEVSPLDTAGPLELRYQVEDTRWALTNLSEGLVALPEGVLLADLPFLGFGPDEGGADAEERTLDFLLPEPYETEVLYRIHLPDGFAVRHLPEAGPRSFGPGILTSEYEEVDGEVRARLTFRIAERRLSPDQLRALRDELTAFKGEEPSFVELENVGWKHLTAGRVDEAIAEFRRLRRAHPDEAVHLLHLATAYQEVGLHAEAVAAARRAVELEPDAELAHSILGEILLQNPLGEPFAPGFDRQGAIAALRRARELSDEPDKVAINLALALEVDDRGRLYGDREGLAEAIEIYREIAPTFAGTEYEDNLPNALLQAGRPEEAIEVLDGSSDDLETYALLVAAEAVARGPEAAIARADRRGVVSRKERERLLSAAIRALRSHRLHEQAEALSKAVRGPEEGERPFDAIRRYEDVPADPDSPASVLRSFMVAVASDGLGDDPVERYLSQVWSSGDGEVAARVLEALASGNETAIFADHSMNRAAGIDELTALDHGVSLSEWTVEEDPVLGYRVSRSMTYLDDPGPAVIVTREPSGFRILGADKYPEAYGHLALRLANEGDLERAGALLDRAVAVTEPPEDGSGFLSPDELVHRFWPVETPDADDVRLAAAILASWDFPDDEVVETLRRAEVADELWPDRDRALASVLWDLGRLDEALPIAERLDREAGDFFYLRVLLAELGRFDELAERIAEEPDEEEREYLQGSLEISRALRLARQDRFEEAREVFAATLGIREHPAERYNQAAWIAVHLGASDDEALGWARHAVKNAGFEGRGPALHTLAAVLALRGETTEAFETLRRSVRAHLETELQPGDWFVLGLIAEHHGLPDAARAYYRKVGTPGEDDELSTRQIARERLRALDEDL